jgi:outer membrane lipoprotein-sorting protein
VSDLGSLLEAIHDSRGSWQTLRAEYRVWIHGSRQAAAWQAGAEQSGATSYALLASEGEPEPEESEGRWRVWIAKPDRMRQETEGRALADTTTVVVGKHWWSWNEYTGAQTNEGSEEVSTAGIQYAAWLEPALVLGALRFEPPAETTHAGRAALRTTARRPEASRFAQEQMTWDLHSLGGIAEEYVLDVDIERGILLRVECRFRGEPFLVGEVTDLAFDEDLDPRTFVLEPPEGEEIRPVESLLDRRHFHETVTEAAAAAPFSVFILPSVPEDWRIRVWTTPAEERPPHPHTVTVDYSAEDGTSGLSIANFPAGESDIEAFLGGGPPFEEVKRTGLHMRARSRSEEWPQTTVYLTRDGTDLRLMSDELDGETVVELAAKLVAAPTSPPEL